MSPQENRTTATGQGRLNQWAHWARAQGPRIFLRGPQLAVVKYFLTNYLITFAKINCKGNPLNTFQRGAAFGWGAKGPNAGEDATATANNNVDRKFGDVVSDVRSRTRRRAGRNSLDHLIP